MPSPLEFQLRLLIARYVTGQIALERFENALLKETWRQPTDPGARKLVAAVELKLAEYTSGHLTTGDLKMALRQFNAGTGIVPVEIRNVQVEGTADVAPAQAAVAV